MQSLKQESDLIFNQLRSLVLVVFGSLSHSSK